MSRTSMERRYNIVDIDDIKSAREMMHKHPEGCEAWGDLDPLSDRERQILRLSSDVLSGSEIVSKPHLSEGTVRNYLSEAIGKTGR